MDAQAAVFARIFKVDEERRLVYGRATQEVVDRADEVFDYDSSKPLFASWSADCHKDSAGKSLGNLRAMHQAIAAGRLEDITFDDTEKAIDIAAKVVDDNEWGKVLEGVYTGFSVGGKYERKWADKVDGKRVTRFTARPNEISLVDRPCVPTAKFFDVLKGDGSTVQKMFKEFTAPADSTSGIAPYSAKPDKKKKKGDKDADKEDDMAAAEKVDLVELAKGCEGVASFADLIQRLKWLADNQRWERESEGDASDLPERLSAQAKALLYLLADMAREEGDELTAAKADQNQIDSASFIELIQTGVGKLQTLSRTRAMSTANQAALAAAKAQEEKDREALAKANACDDDAETADEKEKRLAARKAKKDAEARKAAGLPADGNELADLLAKSSKAAAEAATLATATMFAKIFGVDVDKLEKQDALAKAATGAAASESDKIAAALEKGFGAIMTRIGGGGDQQQLARPALFVVGKDGKAEKMVGNVDVSKVEPVQGGVSAEATNVATMIKAIHAQRPDVLNGQIRALGASDPHAE